MPICISKLNFNKIRSILKEKYDINCFKVETIANCSANVFIIFSDDNQKYVLKEFQDNFDASKIEREILIINYLQKNDIPVPILLTTSDEKFFFLNETNYLYLQKYIDGKTERFHSSSYNHQLQLAFYYNKIIKFLNMSRIDFPEYNYRNFDKNEMEKNIYNFEILLNKTNDKLVIEMLQRKKKMLNVILSHDFLDINKMTCSKSHGDFNISQIIFDDNDKIKGILDFASAKKTLISWELFRSYLCMDPLYDKGNFNFDGLVRYLKAFNTSSLLNIYDLKNMFLVYFMYVLNSRFGLEQYILNNDKSYLKIGQNLFEQCLFLGKNMEKLENKILLKSGEIIK